MELLVPFMLFILDWRGDTPQLMRHPVVYEDEQDCQAAGTQIMLERYTTAGETRFWCMSMPSGDEFDALMQQIEEDHIARREAREADRASPDRRPQP